MASIKKLDERRYKITVSNGYRPDGRKISKAKTIHVPPNVPKRGIGQYVAHAAEELGRGFQNDRRFEIKSHEAPDGLKEKKGRGGRNLPVALFQRIEAPYISDSLGAKPNHFSYSLA